MANENKDQSVPVDAIAHGLAEVASAILALAEAITRASKPVIVAQMAKPATQRGGPSGDPKQNLSTCRNCGDEILWCTTRNGKKMPVNAGGNPSGDMCLHDGMIQQYNPQFVPVDAPRYSKHWDACGKDMVAVSSAAAPAGLFEDGAREPGADDAPAPTSAELQQAFGVDDDIPF